jgi:hypothetical protein
VQQGVPVQQVPGQQRNAAAQGGAQPFGGQ